VNLQSLGLLFNWGNFFFRLQDGNNIGVLLLGAVESGIIVGLENLDLDSQYSLSEEDVSDSGVYVVLDGVTRVDHHTVDKLHGLCSLASDFTGDDDFAASGAVLHDESENTIGGSSDGETSEELVSEGFSLGDCGETSVGYSLDVEVDLALLVAPSLVDDSGELPDSSGLLSEDLAGSGGDDDNFASLGLSYNDAAVSILGKLSLEELVEFSLEHTISDKEVLFGNHPGLDLRVGRCHDRCYFFGLFCKFDLRL